jgi:hypothetical protein
MTALSSRPLTKRTAPRGLGLSLDPIAGEPQILAGRVELVPVKQAQEVVETVLNVTDGIGGGSALDVYARKQTIQIGFHSVSG